MPAHDLLVIAPDRRFPQAVEMALEAARESGRTLLAIYITDSELPNRLGKRLGDSEFLSGEATHGIADAVRNEQREQGAAFLEEIMRRAEAANIACEVEIRPGPMELVVPIAVRKRGVRHVLLPRKKPGRLSRYFRASLVEELAAQLPCQVTILDFPSPFRFFGGERFGAWENGETG